MGNCLIGSTAKTISHVKCLCPFRQYVNGVGHSFLLMAAVM